MSAHEVLHGDPSLRYRRMPMAISPPQLPRLVLQHHPVGASTGYLAAEERARGVTPSWATLAARAMRQSADACEFAALSEPELPGLVDYLRTHPSLPFNYLSVHAPSKQRVLPEAELVEMLCRVARRVDAIVLHPDVIENHAEWARLGSALVIENMDPRKADGQTATSLADHFARLPEAGLCFDVAHAYAIDPSLHEGHAILDAHGDRLRHLHVSALDVRHHHVPLDAAGERKVAALLERCRDVPWILEAPLA